VSDYYRRISLELEVLTPWLVSGLWRLTFWKFMTDCQYVPFFCGTRRFITVFTHRWNISRGRLFHRIPYFVTFPVYASLSLRFDRHKWVSVFVVNFTLALLCHPIRRKISYLFLWLKGRACNILIDNCKRDKWVTWWKLIGELLHPGNVGRGSRFLGNVGKFQS